MIERVRRGYYHWTQDYGESEVVIINGLFPDAVLCMEDVYKRQVWKMGQKPFRAKRLLNPGQKG